MFRHMHNVFIPHDRTPHSEQLCLQDNCCELNRLLNIEDYLKNLNKKNPSFHRLDLDCLFYISRSTAAVQLSGLPLFINYQKKKKKKLKKKIIKLSGTQTICSFNQCCPGESANAVPHYHKLCSRDSHIWGIRRGQHNRECNGRASPWVNHLPDHGVSPAR